MKVSNNSALVGHSFADVSLQSEREVPAECRYSTDTHGRMHYDQFTGTPQHERLSKAWNHLIAGVLEE